MLIRHAEKPIPGGPNGVNLDGSPNDHALIVRGWHRAGALVSFFAKPTHAGIATPTTIFASGTSADPSLPPDEAESLRPQQTVTPVHDMLGVPFQTAIAVGDEAAVIEAITACTGVVLVAWEHKHIPIIAAGFVDGAPTKWGDRFDVVWVLDHQPDGTYAFSALDQSLLAGDVTS